MNIKIDVEQFARDIKVGKSIGRGEIKGLKRIKGD